MSELITQTRPATFFNHITPKFAKRVATETFKAETREMADSLRISTLRPNTEMINRLQAKLKTALAMAQIGKGHAQITTDEMRTSFKAQNVYWDTTAKLLKNYLKPHI